jgi:hypothetical protein
MVQLRTIITKNYNIMMLPSIKFLVLHRLAFYHLIYKLSN